MRSFAEAKKGIKFLQHMPRALSEGADDLMGDICVDLQWVEEEVGVLPKSRTIFQVRIVKVPIRLKKWR